MLLYFSLCTSDLLHAELVWSDCTHPLKAHKECFSVDCTIMIKRVHKIRY